MYFKRPKLKASEFGVREGFLIKKVLAEKMGHLILKPTLKYIEFRLLLGQKEEDGRGCFWKAQATSRVPLMISMPVCKTEELLAGRLRGEHRLEHRESERPHVSHCYIGILE